MIMKNVIYPLLKEGHVSRKLQEETRRRLIPLLPVDGPVIPIYSRLILKIKLLIQKVLKQL